MDLDKASIEIECPRCGFFGHIFFRQARLRDVVICRGCKASIRLDDNMNECRKARAALAEAIADLERSLAQLGGTFTIRL